MQLGRISHCTEFQYLRQLQDRERLAAQLGIFSEEGAFRQINACHLTAVFKGVILHRYSLFQIDRLKAGVFKSAFIHKGCIREAGRYRCERRSVKKAFFGNDCLRSRNFFYLVF